MDIKTIKNGFIFNNIEYLFDEYLDIISNFQAHIGTNRGIILLDLTCTINGNDYTDINLFIQALKGQ